MGNYCIFIYYFSGLQKIHPMLRMLHVTLLEKSRTEGFYGWNTLSNTHQEFFQKVLHLFKKVLDVFWKTIEAIKQRKRAVF